MGKFLKAQYPENQIFSEQTILGLFLVELRLVGLFITFSAVATRRLRTKSVFQQLDRHLLVFTFDPDFISLP